MKPLRIGIIGNLYTMLPPKNYGGIERVLYTLAEALHDRGHDVTIFGPDQIDTSCRSVPFGPVRGEQNPPSWRDKLRLWSLLSRHAKHLDVVHNFFGAALLLPILPRRIPKLISYACPLSSRTINLCDRLAGNSIHYAVCGQHMLSQVPLRSNRVKWHVVYNPVDTSPYAFQAQPNTESPYLVFLSRLTPAKGAHHAIRAAMESGKRLIIAGNVQPFDGEYFESRIKPFIDGTRIQYVGPVNDVQKSTLLGGAEAMLFPIDWDEPFGLVVAEAMACGTPVVTFNRGAMSEIITHGKTGFLCADIDAMVHAVAEVHRIDRETCRASILSRYAPQIIAEEYEKVYQTLLN